MIQVPTCCPVKSLPRWAGVGATSVYREGRQENHSLIVWAMKCFQVENEEGKAEWSERNSEPRFQNSLHRILNKQKHQTPASPPSEAAPDFPTSRITPPRPPGLLGVHTSTGGRKEDISTVFTKTPNTISFPPHRNIKF